MSCNLTFTSLLCKKAEEYFEAARPFFGSRAQEIEDGLAQCSAAQQVCMKYLYGTMPISDIANYDFSLFLKYVDPLPAGEHPVVQQHPGGHLL